MKAIDHLGVDRFEPPWLSYTLEVIESCLDLLTCTPWFSFEAFLVVRPKLFPGCLLSRPMNTEVKLALNPSLPFFSLVLASRARATAFRVPLAAWSYQPMYQLALAAPFFFTSGAY